LFANKNKKTPYIRTFRGNDLIGSEAVGVGFDIFLAGEGSLPGL
jgi:hypothetical protein